MSEDTNSHDTEGWTVTRLLNEMERINRDRSGDDNWSFDDEQRAAIRHGSGPLYVTAGPGSGKSEVVVTRGLKLLVVENVDPRSIVLTTFTEKAAENLRDRLDDRIDALGLDEEIDTADIWVGTMHELAADIMREYHHAGYRNIELLDGDAQQMFIRTHSDFVNFLAGDEVMDDWEATTDVDHVEDGEQWRWFSGAMDDYNDQYGPNKFEAAKTATKLFNRLSQYQVDVNALANSGVPYLRVLAEAYEQYLEALQESRRCDFARLQEEFLEFLDSDAGETFLHGDEERNRPPLEHVLVDEYQDVNPLQEEIYLRLTENMPAPNITVVGDDDQALYRFRGATVDCFIQFPETVSERLGINESAVQRVQLRHNYRSMEDIVRWNNDFISNHLTMQEDGARAEGKMPMVTTRDDGDVPRVKLLKGPNAQATADRVADTIEAMHDEGYIQDYSQVALLFNSTRERWTQWGGSPTFVGRLVRALEARDIPVHNPRNKAFMEHQETQLLIAALARCIDPGLQWASDRLMGGVADDFWEWQDTLDDVIDNSGGDELREYLNETARAVEGAEEGSVLNRSPLDVFLRIRSCSPVSEWTQGSNRDPARAKRLGRLTDLLESFVSMATGVTGDRKLTRTTHNLYDTVSTRFLGQFYYTFCQYLSSMGLDDPEDEYNQIPSGYVQVMTVHQAKGLEFPVIFAGNLHYTPRTGSTYWLEERFRPYAHRGPVAPGDVRAERDLIRQFYVAYSRAEDNLVLVGRDDQIDERLSGPLPAFGFTDEGDVLSPAAFGHDRRIVDPADIADLSTTVGEPNGDNVRRPYSIVGDVLTYRRCRRQYGFVREYNFEMSRATQLFYGKVVHETLDLAHQHYRGDIDGVEGGEVPTATELREYFDEVVTALREQRVLPVNQQAIETAFKHIRRFNEREGPDLYPYVVDTERHLKHGADDFRLEGVVDVLVDTDEDETQVWDYKAGRRPDEGDDLLEDYREQLYVYAVLFREQNGYYPDRGVVYFINEEDRDQARFEVDFSEGVIEDALARFEDTVREIEATRDVDGWSDITEGADEATCAECDFRWDCPAVDYDDR